MNKIEEMIKEYCPNGVEFRELWSITIWDKKFKNIPKYKQNKILSFKHISAELLKSILIYDIKINDNDKIKLLSTGNFIGYTTEENITNIAKDNIINYGEIISIPSGGSATIKYYNGKFVDSGNLLFSSSNNDLYLLKYIYYFLLNKKDLIESYYRGAGIKHPDMNKILNILIPIPPLPIQQQIVNILDKFTELEAELEAELEVRKKQYEYYRDRLLEFGEDEEGVEWRELGEIGNICMCKRIMKNQTNNLKGIPFYKIGTFGKTADSYISQELYNIYKDKYSFPKKGDILISASGTIGKTIIYNGEPAYFQDSNIVWLDNNEKKILNKFLFYIYQKIEWKIEGSTIQRLYNKNFSKIKIPIPSLEKQQQIVSILDKFDTIVNSITEGLPKEIELRKKQYEYYRDKLLTFKNINEEENE